MNELQIFNNEEFGQVRTVTVDGEPWFVLKDIADILNIENHKDLPKRLDDDEVGRFNLPHPQNPQKNIEMLCVNESGLYAVIIRSDKPNAKKFRKWITSEVIPTIRKTGTYSLQKKATIREVIDLIKITRQTMKEQGIAPKEIAMAVKEIGEQHGIDFPEFFVSPEKTTMDDVMGMVDFVYQSNGRKSPTYEDFITYQSSVNKIENENQ